MKLPQRLENALNKLYKAYLTNQLHPEDACRCAVGNILNNNDSWKHLSDSHGSLELNYIGKVHQAFGKKFQGYSPSELLAIEAAFLKGCGYSLPFSYQGKKPKFPKGEMTLFNGLQEAISLLCSLDNVKNVMEITQLFHVEKIKKEKMSVVI
ncbi:MAG: Na(+)-translocating NADH-quinone reductase subunit F [Flavobacteriaceae bacterium]